MRPGGRARRRWRSRELAAERADAARRPPRSSCVPSTRSHRSARDAGRDAVRRRSAARSRRCARVTPRRREVGGRAADRVGWYVGRTRSAPSISRIRRLARSMRAKVVLQRLVRDLAERSGQLDARRPRADDDERQPARRRLRVGLALGRLEGQEHPPADLGRVLDGLEPRRTPLPSRRGRSSGSPRPPRRSASRTASSPSRKSTRRLREVEVDDLAEQHRDVAPALEDRPEGMRDVGRRQAAGRDLIEQRLEEVEVASVDQRDVDGRARAAPGRRRARRTRRRR